MVATKYGTLGADHYEQALAAATWKEQAAGTANAALTLTKTAAPADQAHYVTAVHVSWTGAAPTSTGVLATLESPAATVLVRKATGSQAGFDLVWPNGIKAADAAAVVLSVAAGGVGAIAQATVVGYTK